MAIIRDSAPVFTGSSQADDLHVCAVYRRPSFEQIAIPFLVDGLAAGDRCLLVAEPELQEVVSRCLAEAGRDVRADIAHGALLLPKPGDYPVAEEFSPAGMVAFLRGQSEGAQGERPARLRVLGEMGWAVSGEVPVESLVDFERLLTELCTETGARITCLYDEERFDPALLERLLLAHPIIGIDGRHFPSGYYESLVTGGTGDGSPLRRLLEQLEQLHNTQEELRRREREFTTLAELAPDLIARFDRELRHTYVNPAVTAATGIPVESFIGRTNEELGVAPEPADPWRRTLERVLESGEPETATFDFETPDGRRHFESRLVPEFGAEGRVEAVLGITRDLTERKRLEDALALYREVVANSSEAIGLISLDGTYLEQNQAHRDLLGYTDAELLGQTPELHLGAEKFAEVLAVMEEGQTYRGEVVSRTKSGAVRYIDLAAFPVPGESGKPVCFVGIKRDATARKLMEQQREQLLRREQAARQASEQERARLEEIFRQSPAIVAVVRGQDFVFDLVNPAYAAVTGRTPEQLLGKTVVEALPEIEGQGFVGLLERVHRTGEPYFGEEVAIELQRVPGEEVETRYLTFVYQPLRSAEGEVEGIVAHGIDVTEQVRAREAVRTITDNAGSALMMMDERGVPVFMNPAAEAITGYCLEEICDRPLHESVHYLRPDGSPYPMSECPIDIAATDLVAIRDHEDVFVRKDGSHYHVRGNVGPIDRDGEKIGAVLDFRDVTAEKEAEEELRRANAIKDEFLGLVSHEMRTPLTSVLGYARMLERGGEEMPAERRERMVSEIVASAERLRSIIENMLMLTRLDRDSLEVEAVDLVDTLERLVREHRERHRRRAIRLVAEEHLPPVLANPPLITQVVLNLLSNAEKYGAPDGEIVVDVREEDKFLAVRVLDDGEGIAPHEADAIFEVFYRSEGSKHRPGVGLGLPVCRRLIETHGGTIWAKPRSDGGTEVGFRLPVEHGTARSSGHEPASS